MVTNDMSKYTIVTLEEVHSTNSYALEHIRFYEDKNIVFTSHQTSGRGRFDRHWVCDNSENLFMSIILKPENVTNYPFPNLTQYLSVVVCKVLEKEFSLKPSIKWPNDILVENAKISGILAESCVEKNQIIGLVLGLGLNVNMKKETLDKIDQRATSIGVLTEKQYDVEVILRKICDEFFENYDAFIKGGFEYIKTEYINRCGFLGKDILIRESGERKPYFAKSIDDEGLLVAIDELNNECKIITGDVLC
ncbi:MAG: biotin--[acetyl-CoA-carboxylase] ligase [Cyanobacteria bacterium SIG29]|nr:biotin--[acetyl-CoA-carboxylase] ligase [Cyanobacteria bacterium SIG29]